MKDREYLVDSNIIIYHLNGETQATYFLEKYIEKCCISRLTFIEVMSFSFSDEDQKNVIALLESFPILDTSEGIALQCLVNRKSRKIKIADNIIGATAQVNELILVTRNTKDFNALDIELLNIFENE